MTLHLMHEVYAKEYSALAESCSQKISYSQDTPGTFVIHVSKHSMCVGRQLER